ncbi:hypothetical protein [Microbacterium sp. Marseille-Q6965]|uniref:hypothetical protein n=1 Tax=Microbacterium sp. Marseille-Q6965 TaxID=2965072 RepID=UPI0021B77D75|nr:hypothetical protein [Microbacterium sp. Marseille-Q6965]
MRTPDSSPREVFHRQLCPVCGHAAPHRAARRWKRSPGVSDLIYLLGVIALFALVGVVAKAVERL